MNKPEGSPVDIRDRKMGGGGQDKRDEEGPAIISEGVVGSDQFN